MAAENRTGRLVAYSRKTRETQIDLELDPDRPGVQIDTGVPFFDHMLQAMSFHGRLGLKLTGRGDLEVEPHHLVEDCGLAIGEVLWRLLQEHGPVARFGHAVVPMDEALAEVAIDVCGRPTLVLTGEFPQHRVGAFDLILVREFLTALASRGRIALHAALREGVNSHHLAEALFKALGRALHQAYRRAEEGGMSTKGTITT